MYCDDACGCAENRLVHLDSAVSRLRFYVYVNCFVVLLVGLNFGCLCFSFD